MILPMTTPDLQASIDEIVREISPLAIVCFGHSVSTVNHTSCFNTTSSEKHHYDLLIVQSVTTHYKDHELVDLVNNKFREHISVNVLAHSEQSVCSALQQQHPFFSKIFKEGHMLHQSCHAPFALSNGNITEPDIDHKSLQECQRSFTLAKSFEQLATHAFTNHQYDVAVFLLHQVMEQLCIASIRAHLQYRPASHNLCKLINLVSCYLPQAKNLFPCNTTEETELFNYLKRAYSEVRYTPNYQIPSYVVFALFNRIHTFLKIIEAKYHEDFADHNPCKVV